MLDTPPNARTPFRFIHEEPPASGQTMELFEGLHWARFPLPSRLGHVNIWLLEGDDGWTIIDTGMNNAATAEVWESLFAGLLSTRPIASIIVTHSHSDHIGHLQHLHQRAPSAPVVMTLSEYFVCLMRLYEPNDRLVEQGALTISLCGPPPEVIEKMVSIRTGVRGAFSGLPLQYTRIAAGDMIRAGNRSWEVFTFGGHSSEMVCLLDRDGKVFIAADQVLSNITPSINVQMREPWGNPLKQFYDSFRVLLGLPDDCAVLPSHGRPFMGLHERVIQLRDHHDERLDYIMGFVPQAVTPYHVATKVFERAMGTNHSIQAMFETLAHLNFLEVEGRAISAIDDKGVLRFAPPGSTFPGRIVQHGRPSVIARR